MNDSDDKLLKPLFRTKLPGWDEYGSSAYVFYHKDDPIDWDKLLKQVRAMPEPNKKEDDQLNDLREED